MKKVFIDGSVGTTGLRIYERLGKRSDIELLTLSESDRKNNDCRKMQINNADIVFLCLPDAAAVEAVAMCVNKDTVILDTSTAHRTAEGWIYGFPEIDGDYEKIKSAKRIAVPGCHASGFIALIKPLVGNGLLNSAARLNAFSLTGYSGGGKKMIAQYEDKERPALYGAPRQYALSQAHKHLPEMKAVCGLKTEPVFCPIVADFYSGMEVTVPLFAEDLNGTAEDIKEIYASLYNGEIVKYIDHPDSDGLLSAAAMSGRDSMEISVFGNQARILLTARYDNLGKGASGAAIELMNIVLGTEKDLGLTL